MIIFKVAMLLLCLGLTIHSAITGDKSGTIINFACTLVWLSVVKNHRGKRLRVWGRK